MSDNPNEGPGFTNDEERVDALAALLEADSQEQPQAEPQTAEDPPVQEPEAEADVTAIEALEALKAEMAAEEGQDADETEDAEPDRYTVKVNGEEIDVTLDELRHGYSRQQDYTQKTKALADQRRAIAAERSQAGQMLQSTDQRLGGLIQAAEDLIAADVQQAEALRQVDPNAYAVRLGQLQQRDAILQQIRSGRQAALQQHAQYARDTAELDRQVGFADLEEAIPEFATQEGRQKIGGGIRSLLQKEGFPPDMVAALDRGEFQETPRVIRMLHRLIDKADRYDQLVAREPEIAKTVKRVQKSGVARSREQARRDGLNARVKRAVRSGDDELKAAVLAELI